MDVRVALDDLRRRIDPIAAGEGTPRRLLEAFLEHAADVVTYEDGVNSDDWVVVESSVVEDARSWYPEETRPEPGSLLVSFERTMYLHDEEDEFVQFASTSCALVFPPVAVAVLPAPVAAAAPSGHRLTDPDDLDPDGEGPGSLPGYVTDHASLLEHVLQQLGPLADEVPQSWTVDGDVPTEPTRASLHQPSREPVRLEVHPEYVDAGFAGDDLVAQVLGRALPGAAEDTGRVLQIFLEFCARPLAHGDAILLEDRMTIEFDRAWDDDAPDERRHTLRLERRSVFRGSAAIAPHADVALTLEYRAARELESLPEHLSVRAPAASHPRDAHGRAVPFESHEPVVPMLDVSDEAGGSWMTITVELDEVAAAENNDDDAAASIELDVEVLEDVPATLRTSPIALLLTRRADELRPANSF